MRVVETKRHEAGWIVSGVTTAASGCCPGCGSISTSYHGSKVRVLQDLPVQGSPVSLTLRQAQWRCRNPCCARKAFVTPLPESAPRFARRTRRVTDLTLLLVHAAGGRPAERLMRRLGLSQSDDTLLRSLKRQTANNGDPTPVRVVGIDDWSWLKGASYGTIMVDLERREVLDVLADRSADGTAAWLACRPEVEIISRDRCGLYAEGATRGAPQAGQVADRFHLIQNLRQSIQQQLSRAPLQQEPFAPGEMEPEPQQPQPGLIHRYGQPEVTEHRRLANAGRRAARRSRFDQLKILQATGKGLSEIVRETGLNWRTVARWTRLDILPERGIMAPKPTTPNHFRKYLAQRWAEGCTFGRQLLAEIRPLGYTGSLTHLQRLLRTWRQAHFAAMAAAPLPSVSVLPQTISCVVAAALCIKPRGLLTAPQAEKVDLLKATSPDFATMRQFAMRFRGILRGQDTKKLDAWLDDARDSGIHCLRQFAIKARQDLTAVQNAVTERWSNGQTEGQINRLKTLKRAMYGRAGVDLLRARMVPLRTTHIHPN
ncbi:ISL3 family transposase [Methylosinus sp. H3A]|uniref:ISL3 family transposase n=1 Tax=Methylosinus sp. H3A TaxID=2785786 RepID=UPI003916E808